MLKIKFFKKIAKVSWTISLKTVIFIKIRRTYFAIRQTLKPKKLLKLSKDIKHATPEQLFLNQASFKKKAVDFSVELSSKALFRTTKSLSFIFSHSRLSKQFDLLLNNLSENHFNGFKNYLFCSNDAQQSVSTIFLKL
jgi:transcription-repair coupling factor (superfamily II helicase)